MFLTCVLCAALLLIALGLSVKIAIDHHALRELREDMEARRFIDTNTLLSVHSGDRHIRRLARALNEHLRLLRDERRRLQSGDLALKEAVTNIAHDLRTPLTAICGYMELLEKERLPQAARDALDIISGRVLALRELTEELLQYAVAHSRDCSAAESVVLNHEIETCVAAYYAALKRSGIAPEISMPAQKVERVVNRAALSRILGNIIANAVRYSDGDLRITLTAQGEITFQNHASSLDDVAVGRLFDRFFTVESAHGSTGLGLSIAKALTEQMNGQITAEKAGGLFCVRLWFPQERAQ